MTKVFILKLNESDNAPEFIVQLLRYIPEEGRLRVKDRLNNNSKLQTIAGELLARYSAGQYTGNPEQEINLGVGEKGKPFIRNLQNVHFNISHSGHYVVCAVASTEIGIDVERVRKANLRIAERFFSSSEVHDLMELDESERIQYFITLWTIKESYLKAIGRGLTQHLNSFTVCKNNDSYFLIGDEEAEKYCVELHQLTSGYKMAVCTLQPYSPSEISYISFENILSTLPIYP